MDSDMSSVAGEESSGGQGSLVVERLTETKETYRAFISIALYFYGQWKAIKIFLS